jgi:photosystem II stability/assembly factor-like uncharacterized protein
MRAAAEPPAAEPPSLAAAGDFRHWLEDQPDPVISAAMREGRTLLEARRRAIGWMIRNAPETALVQALSFAERERLPEEWLPLVEERFSEVAAIQILPDCSPGACGSSAHILLERNGQATLRGRTWGRMAGFLSKNHLPVEGIALDGWTALAESGVKPVSGVELATVERLFPPAPGAAKTSPEGFSASALIGGQVHRFAAAADLIDLRGLYAEVAALPGPHSADPLVINLGDGDPRPYEDIAREARDEASSWTETPKTVLVLNTVFPDRTTPVGTQAEYQSVMSEVSDWLSANSYGKTNLIVTVPPNVFTLPSPVSTYEPDERYPQIMADAKALALAAGINPANYDISVVAFPRIASWWWAGMASIGGGNLWLNGYRSPGVIAHELGHNYGLWHASSWDVDDGSVMPATGAPSASDPRHEEYGDPFSIMGSSSGYPDGHYCPHGKAALNWINQSQVETVATPGTYRIQRFDHSAAGTKPRLALKLQRAGSQTFWLGYRRSFTSNSYLSNGAYMLWEFQSNKCRLLDMTPDSQSSSAWADKQDAPLAIGRTFADPTASLYITPIAQGGAAPDEWLDVRVEFSVTGNRDPIASITLPPGGIAARGEVTFSAIASDPDDDPLTYVWNFGNGETATGPQVNRTFEAGGSGQVSLRVTDGKGGLAEATATFTVSDPLAEIEEVALPDSSSLCYEGALLGGLHVAIAGRTSLASPDGSLWHPSPNIQGSPNLLFQNLAAGDGRFVAVGSDYDVGSGTWIGATATSTDAVNWIVRTHAPTPRLNAVAFHGGVFAAVGDLGTILTSPDGTTWTPRSAPAYHLYAVIVTGSGFVACGQQGTILTSPGGVAWTPTPTPASWPTLRGLAADGLKVACVGLGSTYWWSENGGMSWQSRNFMSSGFSPTLITWGEGLWVAAESRYLSESSSYELRLAVSRDGSKWGILPPLPHPNPASGIRFADDRLWIYGQAGNILRSGPLHTGNHAPTLQVNWPATLTVRTNTAIPVTTNDADSDPVALLWELDNSQRYDFGPVLAYRALQGGWKTLTAWVSDGRGGHAAASHTYLVDDPLLYWSDITSSALEGAGFVTAACGNGRAVMAGGSVIVDAPEDQMAAGTAWIKRSLPSPTNWYAYGVAYRQPGFVVVGQNYDFSASAWRSSVRFSNGGQSWSSSQFLDGARLNAVAGADAAYVAVGDGGVIVRSTDGQSWSRVAAGLTNSNIYSVAFVGARGLAVGSGGALLRSEDSGAAWENVAATIGNGMSSRDKVHAADGLLFITGPERIRRYDPVSRLWQDAMVAGGAFGSVQALVRHDGVHVAIAERYDSSLQAYQRYIIVSEDGLAWAAAEFPLNADVAAITSGGGNLVAAGSDGILANLPGLPGLALDRSSIRVSRASIDSGTLGTVKVLNSGAGALGWSASSDAAWLGLSAATGETTFAGEQVAVNLLRPLAAGTHIATVTFSASGVPNRTLQITVDVYQDDHANTRDQATAIVAGSAVDGKIESAEDADWFSIAIEAPGTLTVWTTGTLDTTGELHGATRLLASNDDFDGDTNFLIERVLLPGRYWVKVDGIATQTGEYALHALFVPAGPDFAVKAMVSAGGGTQWSLTIASAIGYRYHVEESSTLEGTWTKVGATVTAVAEETVITVAAPVPRPQQHFYRVAVEAPQ